MFEYLLLEYAYLNYSLVFLDPVMSILACRGNLIHQSTCKNTGSANYVGVFFLPMQADDKTK